ncbi:MAG: NAD(P)-binding domain-containing protein [Bryobacteraceae bacterium]|nr:NAD(P)-binding domain-containing protein [Bryobacteraceae bacterium]
MVIAIVGSGNVGGALARLWTAAGHDVRVAGRQNCAQTILPADAVALCVPWSAAETALASCGDLGGKTLIDCTNPINSGLDGLVLGGSTSAAEHIQMLAPDASVVKAFNTIGASMLGNAGLDGGVADGFYCGDSATAKQVVSKLIAATALRPVDVGPLRNARYLEAMAMLWIDLAVNQKKGPTFAFTVAGWSGAA